MQSFTFHRNAARLRSEVRMWQVAVSAEATIMVAMGIAVRWPANLYILLITPCYFAFVWWLYSSPLRRRHLLTETTLTLVEKSGRRFAIPRDQIRSVRRFTEPLPHGVLAAGYKYLAEEDTLYILPDKTSLVEIGLAGPVSGRLTARISVEFTRVICLVDEVDGFIAAVLPEAEVTPQAPVRPPAAKPPVSLPHPAGLARGGAAALELCDLTRRFGSFTAVDRLTLQVAPGEIFAFLGSNGAGKSTTIRMTVGLLRPTSGQVRIGGQDPWRALGARRLVGYLPDTPMLYENLTAQEHLWLIGGLYELPDPEARHRALELLAQMGLQGNADQPVRTFSLGMKRKLAIAAALMHRPPVLLLDEATNGLDPRAAHEVKQLIRDEARSGTTIFLTTHRLDLVSDLAGRIAMIDQGTLRACGTLPELQRTYGRPQGSLEELFLLATDRRQREAMA